jgi:hypothetical protein
MSPWIIVLSDIEPEKVRMFMKMPLTLSFDSISQQSSEDNVCVCVCVYLRRTQGTVNKLDIGWTESLL